MRDIKNLFDKFKQSPLASSLNEEQLEFARIFFNGESVMLTGAAGCGKSFVVKSLFSFLEKENISCVGKTATTGVAAQNIGGTTIHSFAGIGLGEGSPKVLAAEVMRNKKARDRVIYSKILFIDEISMMSGELLDKLNEVFKLVKNNDKPFGGIQLVLSGDFLQLPKIDKGGDDSMFAFESKSWKEAKIKTVVLHKLMRQDENTPFAKMLNDIRVGDVSSVDLLNSRINYKFPDDGIKPIKILSRNVDVDAFNNAKLNELKGEEKVFFATDEGPPWVSNHFDKTCLAPKVLRLKIGAQVMLLRNIDIENGYVNGSIGVVESFTPEGPKVKFLVGTSIVSKESWELKEQTTRPDGEVGFKCIGSRTQIPLKLAYSLTTHKIMGLTVDRAEVDLNDCFAEGSCYVALSRVRDIGSLSITKFPASKIKANSKCIEFYKKSFSKENTLAKTESPKKVSIPKEELVESVDL